MTGELRVGAVSYLNARPLYEGFEAEAPEARLELDLPSRLADRLAAGDLDVALIPSIEYLRGARRGYVILPDAAIAARGPVRSVKLYARVPFPEVRRLALDEGSRTSQALARIWLREVQGVRPETIEPLPIGQPVEESTADAILLIGDRAMRDPAEPFEAVVDLGEAWNAWTGLPFVFAFWVARAGVDLGELPAALRRCKARGLARVERIAARFSAPLGLTPAEAVAYLTKNLSYDLGDPERAALRLFAEKAARLELAPEGVDLVFYDHRNRRLDLATRGRG